MFLLQTSLALETEKWKKRLSMFPEECTGTCEGGTAIDFMLKPGRESCPENINLGQYQDDFLGSYLEHCQSKVKPYD